MQYGQALNGAVKEKDGR